MGNPIITAHTHIAAVFSEIDYNSNTLFWCVMNYFNLYTKLNTNDFFICGISPDVNKYSLHTCPYLDKKIMLYDLLTINDLKMLLRNKYKPIIKINTEKLGITNDLIFIHEVFLTNINNDIVDTYDFWAPNFKWDKRQIEISQIWNAIEYERGCGAEIVSIKRKEEKTSSNYNTFTETESVRIICNHYLTEVKVDDGYWGINVYIGLIKHVQTLENIHFLNLTPFAILYDHYKIWSLMLALLKEYISIKYEFVEMSNTLIKEAYYLRNFIMKIWRSGVNSDNWKQKIIQKLERLREIECSLLNKIQKQLKED